MILGIFRQNNIFIDKIVLFPCQHKIREYYPIQNRYFSYDKNCNNIYLCLVYRHGWFSSWSMLTCTWFFFVCVFLCFLCIFFLQNATTRSPWFLMTRFLYLFIYLFIYASHSKNYRKKSKQLYNSRQIIIIRPM